MILSLTLAFSLALSQDLSRHVYPMAPPHKAPAFAVDVSAAPEAAAWAAEAKLLSEAWFGHLTSLLSTVGATYPREVKLVFKPDISAPAYASGDTITINSTWIRNNPHDFGMVIHELVHIVQQYPRNPKNVGWLVEGIADYLRWWRFEPEAPRTIITKESKMTDGYGRTAYFLAWAGKRYDLSLVPKLDKALREARDPMPVFEAVTGKSADDLWREFVEATSG